MSKIKVLPVYPEFPATFWSFKYAVEFLGKKSSMPPLGLATVAAMLPSDRFEVQKIVDLNVGPLSDKQIRDSDIGFFSSMIVQGDSQRELIDRFHFYGKETVAGGPFATSYPERSNAKYVVGGEAEVTLGPFLEDLVVGRAERVYTERSVVGRVDMELTPKGKPTIVDTPLPRWDLLDLENYASAAIQYSRGCPFNCDFCDITKLYGRESRTKTPEQMIGEFEALRDTGYRGPAFIVDDNFIGNTKSLREFLPRAIEWQRKNGFPFNFFTEASMNLAWESNNDVLEDMVHAGFDQVFVGIESVDDNALKEMNKGQNVKMPASDAVEKLQSAGLKVTGGFIVGSDGDKRNVFERLYDFIQESGIAIPMPGLLTALKGTDLYMRLEKEGRLREESSGNNTHRLGFNFEPEMDENFLIGGYVDMLGKLFDPKNYYERCKVSDRRSSGKMEVGRPVRREEKEAFVKSMKRQIFAKGGLEYSKYLLETLAMRPKRFPDAIANGVKFYHFNKLTNETLKVHNYGAHAESIYERLRDKVENISGSASVKVVDVERKVVRAASQALHKARREYHKLHADFRSDAKEHLDSLRGRVRKLRDSVLRSYSLG